MIALADLAVVVSDAAASARWWNEKLGFAVHTVGGSGHALMVAPPGDRFVLHLCEGIAPVEPGNSGIAFMTDDLEQLVLKMRAAGVEFPEPLQRQSWGASAKFADPDGNIFWLLGAPAAFVRSEAALRAPGTVPPCSRGAASGGHRSERRSRPARKRRGAGRALSGGRRPLRG